MAKFTEGDIDFWVVYAKEELEKNMRETLPHLNFRFEGDRAEFNVVVVYDGSNRPFSPAAESKASPVKSTPVRVSKFKTAMKKVAGVILGQ